MKIVCICGMSSSGKNEIVNRLKKEGIKEIVSYTNRPIRKGEKKDTYNFVNTKEIEYMIDNLEFLEYRQYKVASGNIWYYGIAKHSIDLNSDNNYVVILDLHGLEQLKQYLINNNCINCLESVYIDVDAQERLLRSLHREGNMQDSQVDEIVRRFIKDKEDFSDYKDKVDYVLKNNDEHDFFKTLEFIKGLY